MARRTLGILLICAIWGSPTASALDFEKEIAQQEVTSVKLIDSVENREVRGPASDDGCECKVILIARTNNHLRASRK
jgi:hypothetical protein